MGRPTATAVVQFDRARLHEMRTTREWRVEDLASRAHCSTAAIRHWEGGVRSPTIDSLARLAFAFDVEIGELLR
jgi:transcriptional regulator with XRE-family HTH domain